MSENVGDFLERDAGSGQQAGGRVPQLVRVPVSEAGLLRHLSQRAAQVGGVEQRPAAGREDQTEVLPVLPHAVLLSPLARSVLPEGVLRAAGKPKLPPRGSRLRRAQLRCPPDPADRPTDTQHALALLVAEPRQGQAQTAELVQGLQQPAGIALTDELHAPQTAGRLAGPPCRPGGDGRSAAQPPGRPVVRRGREVDRPGPGPLGQPADRAEDRAGSDRRSLRHRPDGRLPAGPGLQLLIGTTDGPRCGVPQRLPLGGVEIQPSPDTVGRAGRSDTVRAAAFASSTTLTSSLEVALPYWACPHQSLPCPRMTRLGATSCPRDHTILDMDDNLELPPHAGTSGRSTLGQDLAVLGWVATRPDLRTLTRDLLIDALIICRAMAPLPEVTAEPDGGACVHISALLRDIDQRLSQHPHHADDLLTQTSLVDLHHVLGLARYSLPDPDGARAARARKERCHPYLARLRILETDTAVDLALADLRRQRGA